MRPVRRLYAVGAVVALYLAYPTLARMLSRSIEDSSMRFVIGVVASTVLFGAAWALLRIVDREG
jgi:hypothetical protein